MSLPRRIVAKARRTIAPLPVADTARLDHLDRAVADITNALRELQHAVPPDLRTTLPQRLQNVDEVMPRVLNTISSAHGQQRATARLIADLQAHRVDDRAEIDDLKRQTAELWDRLEAARAELLFELRYQSGAPTGTTGSPTPEVDAPGKPEPEVANQAAVDSAIASGDVRLNLGCGHQPVDGYLNVDMRALPGVDIVATADHLPFDEGDVAELFSAHVVEHFPEEQLTRRLLPYWFGLLRPGGEFRAVVPDAAAMLAGYAAGDIDYDTLREITYGGQEYEGDFHFNMYTTDTLGELLTAAGFGDVEVEAEGRPNGKCLEFQIVARKPA